MLYSHSVNKFSFYFEIFDSALTRKHIIVIMLTMCHQHIKTRLGAVHFGEKEYQRVINIF